MAAFKKFAQTESSDTMDLEKEEEMLWKSPNTICRQYGTDIDCKCDFLEEFSGGILEDLDVDIPGIRVAQLAACTCQQILPTFCPQSVYVEIFATLPIKMQILFLQHSCNRNAVFFASMLASRIENQGMRIEDRSYCLFEA